MRTYDTLCCALDALSHVILKTTQTRKQAQRSEVTHQSCTFISGDCQTPQPLHLTITLLEWSSFQTYCWSLRGELN